MDYTNLIIGIFALCFGLYSIYMRLTNKFATSEKLIQMKARFGESTGNIIHLVAYTILPLLVGIVLLSSIYFQSTN
jgi:hypothetical protein